jgi:hypothetical protein
MQSYCSGLFIKTIAESSTLLGVHVDLHIFETILSYFVFISLADARFLQTNLLSKINISFHKFKSAG